MPSNLKSGIRPQISHFRPLIRLQFSIQPTSQPQIRPPRLYIKSLYPRSGTSDPKSGSPHPKSGKRKWEKIALCRIIGHRPLRGRCPSHLIPTDTNVEASSTADHVTLLRLFSSAFKVVLVPKFAYLPWLYAHRGTCACLFVRSHAYILVGCVQGLFLVVTITF